jgi:hypothetical protein
MNESQAPYRLPARSASRNPYSLIAVTAATISGVRWWEGRPRRLAGALAGSSFSAVTTLARLPSALTARPHPCRRFGAVCLISLSGCGNIGSVLGVIMRFVMVVSLWK